MKRLNVLMSRLSVLALAVQIAILPVWQIRASASENAAQDGTTEEYAQEKEEAEEEYAQEQEEASEGYTQAAETSAVTVTEEVLEEGDTGDSIQGSPEELAQDYLNNRLYGTQSAAPVPGGKMLFRSATRPLAGLNAAVYPEVLEAVKKIADGETDSSVVTVYISDHLDKTSFTAEELGVDTIYEVTTDSATGEKVYKLSSEARQAVYSEIGWEARKLVNYLMANCPYELYWYDKTVNYYHSLSLSYEAPQEVITIPDTGRIRLYLPVSEYYAGEEEYTLNTDRTGVASRAVEYAAEIVNAAADLSDWDKLVYYRDSIFDLVEYDSSANKEDTAYGDPWQIIYVFDRDSSTNVVCEGYAKAFQYLCDLTQWNRQIECRTVTGNLGDDYPEKHMWNVVSLWDGCNFAVDLTNSDTGKPGYPDLLFMVGTDDCEDGVYTLMEGSIYYAYDAETEELYTEESIQITSHDAHDPHYYEGMTPEFIWDEENRTCRVAVVCGLCGEVHYFDAEVNSSEGPQEGLTRYTAVFYAEDHSFTDSVVLEDPEEDSGTGSTESSEGSTGGETSSEAKTESGDGKTSGGGSTDGSSGQNSKEDSSADTSKKSSTADEDKDSGSGSPKVGDMNAESVRSLIGVVMLCIMGIAAVVLLLKKNWGQIREICVDEDGKFDPIGGLERHFTQNTEGESPGGIDPGDTAPDEDFMTMLYRQKGAEMADLNPERDPVREHIIFHGRVQGVGFRYQAMFAARSFDLTGWVENLPDGSVEMEVQGTPAGIGRMMKHLQSGHWIRIDDMDVESIPLVDGERGFGVRGY